MNRLFFHFILLAMSSGLLLCCKREPAPVPNSTFKLVFSNGDIIHEQDISYYDSSTHFIFLKENTTEKPGLTTFKAYVDTAVIYEGIIHPCSFSAPPRTDISISDCFHYGKNIIALQCYTGKGSVMNDPRIIQALAADGRLRNGISCHVAEIQVTPYRDYTRVSCTIVVKNHDKINYYVPDPAKMGNQKFNYFTNGLNFRNTETGVYSFLRWSASMPDWNNVTLNDFTILKSGEDKIFTFESNDYHPMVPGVYEVRFRYQGLNYSAGNFNLNQKDGRVWVGESKYHTDFFLIQ